MPILAGDVTVDVMNTTMQPPNRAADDTAFPASLDLIPPSVPSPKRRGVAASRGMRLATTATVTAVILGLASACGQGPGLPPAPPSPVRTITPAPPTPTPPTPSPHPAPPPDPTPAPLPPTPHPAPRELVGTWHNDPDDVDWYLTLSQDGRYELHSTDLDVYDEGVIDTSDDTLRLITATGDARPSLVVVGPEGCGWSIDSMELYGYAVTQLQLCGRAAWVKN